MDHRYTQQTERLGHERAMNKYTGKLQEKDTTTDFITNVIYYNTKKLQINLVLKVSSPERESPKRRESDDFEKFSKLDVSMVSPRLLSLRSQGTLVMYKVFSSLFIFSALLFEAQTLYSTCMIFLSLLVSDKNGCRI